METTITKKYSLGDENKVLSYNSPIDTFLQRAGRVQRSTSVSHSPQIHDMPLGIVPQAEPFFLSERSERAIWQPVTLPSNPIELHWDWEISRFADIIERRIDYLNSLRTLRDDWISLDSVRPDNESITRATGLLQSLRELVFNYNLQIPKLILGPIPSGGVSIEIVKDADNALYVSIPNNQQLVTLETQENGYFSEYKEGEISPDELIEAVNICYQSFFRDVCTNQVWA
ncbi:MAG: hypothetical protein MUF71_13895 [Candidatus Kapabacteria bacterium]|jgi:CRISPR/Cas system-associated endonuclease/helicase Cas3|nr:hypothetical protein [Candidatus Kapabacteria bacterium]